MKIVYFNYLYDLYGASLGSTRKGELLMAGLSGLGHDVKLYWMKNQAGTGAEAGQVSVRSKIREMLKRRFARYVHNPKRFAENFLYFPREYRIIKTEKPDLVIYRLTNYQFSCLTAAKLLDVPVIIEADAPNMYEERVFETQYWQPPWIGTFIETAVINHAVAGVCVSNVAAQYFRSNGVLENKLHVISNGADVDIYRQAEKTSDVRNTLGLGDRICIGFIGTFHQWHGVDNLSYLIHETVKKYPNVVFLMVGGGGPAQKSLEKYVDENQLADHLIFTGYVPFKQVADYLVAMDIVLAPYPKLSMFHYSPMKLFEYMAAGKAVIASRVGQIAEIINDGENGILCEPDNTSQMVQKLSELLNSPSRRIEIGEKARRTIEAEHTWEIKAKQWEELCHRAVKKEE